MHMHVRVPMHIQAIQEKAAAKEKGQDLDARDFVHDCDFVVKVGDRGPPLV